MGRYLLLMLPAMIGSVLFHAGLVAVFIVYILLTAEKAVEAPSEKDTQSVNAEEVEKDKTTFTVVDVDPSMSESDTDIQYMAERIAEVSVPGKVNADQAVGIRDGDKITLDVANRALEVEIEDVEARREGWTPKPAKYTRGVLGKYAKVVQSAAHGAVCE